MTVLQMFPNIKNNHMCLLSSIKWLVVADDGDIRFKKSRRITIR